MKKSLYYIVILLITLSCSNEPSYQYFDINEVKVQDDANEFEASWMGVWSKYHNPVEHNIKIKVYINTQEDLANLLAVGQKRINSAIDIFLDAVPKKVVGNDGSTNLLNYKPDEVVIYGYNIVVFDEGIEYTEIGLEFIGKINTNLQGEIFVNALGLMEGDELVHLKVEYQQVKE